MILRPESLTQSYFYILYAKDTKKNFKILRIILLEVFKVRTLIPIYYTRDWPGIDLVRKLFVSFL